MDLKAISAVLLRRWYLVLVVIGCTVGATYFVAERVGPTYEAQGAVLVFPPVATVQRGAETVTQGNPYLALDGVSQARDIVIRELTSKKTADDFDLLFPGTTFEATPDVMNNAPIILITVESPGAATAVAGVADLMGRVPATLTALQAGLGLDENSVITSKPLIADQRTEAIYKDQIRAAVVAAVVAAGLGLLAIGLLDGILTGRQKKKRSAKPANRPANNPPGSTDITTIDVGGLGSPAVARRPDNVRSGGSAGVASTRLRPRSPVTSRTKNGSHSMADPAQRR